MRTLKINLFWAYLLQLKEYRFDRLRDHIQTEKGKSLVINRLIALKLCAFGLLAVSNLASGAPEILFGLAIIGIIGAYTAETAAAFNSLRNRSLKMPVFTVNATAVTALIILIQTLFAALLWRADLPLALFAFCLLAFDLLAPLVAIDVVTALKPLNFAFRRRLFAQAAKRRASLKNLLVIGITGSYGKTSTKEMLSTILETKFNVIKTKEHENTEVSIAKLVIKELNDRHEIFICEMGAYRASEIKTVCDIVKPKVGIFIGANEQHLSLFGSMENLLSGEGGGELLQSLGGGSLGIFNGENKHSAELYQKARITKKLCSVSHRGLPETGDVWAKDIKASTDSVSFRVCTKKNPGGEEFDLKLLGAQNVENILLSTAAAEELGMSLKEIASAAKKIKPMPRTMSLTKGKWGTSVIDSTYSSNPDGVRAHIDYLRSWTNARKVFVMPCLIELGAASAKIHYGIGRHLGEVADTVIVTSRERFDDIKRGFYEVAKEKAQTKKRIVYSDDIEEVLKTIKVSASEGDVIFLEGRLPEALIKALKK